MYGMYAKLGDKHIYEHSLTQIESNLFLLFAKQNIYMHKHKTTPPLRIKQEKHAYISNKTQILLSLFVNHQQRVQSKNKSINFLPFLS